MSCSADCCSAFVAAEQGNVSVIVSLATKEQTFLPEVDIGAGMLCRLTLLLLLLSSFFLFFLITKDSWETNVLAWA